MLCNIKTHDSQKHHLRGISNQILEVKCSDFEELFDYFGSYRASPQLMLSDQFLVEKAVKIGINGV